MLKYIIAYFVINLLILVYLILVKNKPRTIGGGGVIVILLFGAWYLPSHFKDRIRYYYWCWFKAKDSWYRRNFK